MECLRLQTVVLLLIHYEKTTVEEILSQMENFAVLFQSQMAEAVDHFSYDRIRSLQKLKQEIPDEPVQRICDALEFCEELPVEEAFLNLEDEREYFLKKNMEERNELSGRMHCTGKNGSVSADVFTHYIKAGRAVCGGGIKRTSCIQPEHDGIFLGKSVIRK